MDYQRQSGAHPAAGQRAAAPGGQPRQPVAQIERPGPRRPPKHERMKQPRLLLQGVPRELRPPDIEAYFLQFGRVTDVYIPRNPRVDGPNISFVTVQDEVAIQKALRVDLHVLPGGFQLGRVTKATDRPNSNSRAPISVIMSERHDPGKPRLFCEGVSATITAKEMEEHFLQYGEITDCYITPPRYRDQQFAGSARTANLCYVTFKHPDALTAALKAVADATGENGYGADRSFRKYQINGHDIGRIIEARPHPKAQKHQQEEVEQAESQPTQLTANPQAAGAIAGLWMAQQLMGFSGTASGQVADTTAEEGGRTSGGRNADDTPGSKQAQSSKRPASASDSSVHAAKRHMQQAYWTRQPGAAQPAVGRYGATSQQSSYQVTEQSTPWQAAVDPASGHTYYVNSQTGQSSWYPPPELGAVQHTASHFSPHQGGGLAVRAAQPASQGTTNAALVPRTGATRSAFASGPVPPSVPLHPSASAGAGPAVFMPQAAVVHRNERTSAAGGALAAAAAVAPSAATESATLVALRAELGGLRLSVLQQRAGLAGLPRTEIMEAVDSENPKRAVLLLLLRHAAAAEAAARTQAEVRAAATASSTAMLEAVQQAQQETARRACRVADQHTAHVELKAVEQKLKSQERDENKAAALDVAVKTAFDETVKQAMAEKAPFLEGLEAKLSAQKLSALQERARKSGADAAALKAANQNDPSNPKRALIQLIMEQAKLYFLKGAREAAQKAEPAIRVAAQKQVELAFAELKVKQEQEAKEAMAPALVQKLRVEGRLPERIQYQ